MAEFRIAAAQRELCFLDIETSHLDPHAGEILDLAAVRTRADMTVVSRMERRCRLDHPERASEEALVVNGYNPREWADAVPVRVALVELASMLDPEVVIVGHGVAFDWSWLEVNFQRARLAVPTTKYRIDTLSMAWPLAVRGTVDRMSLESLCTRYGVSNVGAHRAMADVRRVAFLYCKLLGQPEPRW